MVAYFHRRSWHYPLLLWVASLTCLWNLGGPSLWDLDEGRNATCANEMRESGDLITPKFNGSLRVDKPALLYWLQIAAYEVFGVNEFAGRLPSALAAMATVIVAYELGRSLFGKATGLLGGLATATTPMLCGAARFANPDSLLNLCTVATLTIFWLGQSQRGHLWWLALGTTTGLGMLAKGPVGLVLPFSVAVVFLWWDGRLRILFDRRLIWALLAWCVVALPWYIWVGVDTKAAFLRGFFLEHNAGRFSRPMENHSGGLLYYPLVLLAGTAPWSVFVGPTLWCAIGASVRRRAMRGISPPGLPTAQPSCAPRVDDAQLMHAPSAQSIHAVHRFLLSWITTYVFFFSLAATKLPNYILPVVVPYALLTASFLDRWRRGLLVPPDWWMWCAWLGLALLGFGLTAGLFLVSGAVATPFGQGRAISALAPWTFIGVVPLGGACAACLLWRRGRCAASLATFVASTIVLVAPLAAWAPAAFEEVKAVRALVQLSGARQRHTDMRVAAWRLEYLPSLNFYTQRDVIHLSSEAELAGLLRYPLPVFVFMPARLWEQCSGETRSLAMELGRHRDLYKSQFLVVVSNRIADASNVP
ncbi:MAG: glycosyltransferase family 39 protein [Gemmataceae bacterium]|nr:glycosyltransferase family 39 protein [Gemmataceae bacterium]